ncbi:TRAP transporter small permease [Halomonas icarae]|uniref:TRAP transporter small permease protein n=1 Tax=Halomonas icarae TaxID=2691040 RepID=A0A7X5ANS4_9GAMM|nr:TRAP transporter small permease [Halomonas icarae]MDR5903404.1 TRAP transporter small permease [Halomonas icarae]NAW14234.1 TRAP transporter small permease subunit [Halomonas icarae]
MQTPTTYWARTGRVFQLLLEGVAGATLFGMMLLTTVDVTGRYFFNAPILGAVELTQLMLAALVFLSLPIVCWRQEHVSVDLLDAIFPARLVWVREVLVNLLITVALWVMAQRVWALAERAFSWGDVTEFLRIPYGYLIGLIAIMLALSALLTLARAILYLLEGIKVIKRGGPLSPGGNHD